MVINMKKKAIWKEFFVEIKKSLNRFLSILFIVALGVAFFTGIRATEPDMQLSADKLYDTSSFMDIRIFSSLGLTKEDLLELKGIEEIEKAEGAYSKDVICQTQDSQLAIKVMSLPEELNQITIKEGRIPKTSQECIVDTAFLKHSGYVIGDWITIKSGNEEVLSDAIAKNEFQIVGSCSSPFYLSMERGTTSIGTGSLNGFIMIPKEGFTYDIYTEIYLSVKGTKELLCYFDSYEEKVKAVINHIEDEIKEVREKARYEEIRKEADQKLTDAKKELEEAKKTADQELKDARNSILDGERELGDAKEEIAENEKKLEDGKKEVEEGRALIEEAKKKLVKNQVKVQEAEQELETGEQEYEVGRQIYEEKKKESDENESTLAQAKEALDATNLQLLEQKMQLEANKIELVQNGVTGIALEQVNQGIIRIDQGLKEVKANLIKWEENKQLLETGREELRKAKNQLEASRQSIDNAKEEIRTGKQQILEGETELANQEVELEEAWSEIIDGEKELLEAKEAVAEAEKELENGKKEYEEAKQEAEEKIAEAEDEIQEAGEKIEEIKEAEWYVLDRNTIQTYVEFKQDAERIGAVGEIFPIIFFLVAALVSLTTMTRMVEEQRTQIGTLKALGYSKISIAIKYIGYAFLATLGGSLLGGFVGCKVLPYIIIHAYAIMYQNLEYILIPFNKQYIFIATFVSMGCVLGATTFSCIKELLSVPAELMRPMAPKQGKRVILERIPFIWKHLNFTSKSTVRNLFRYKKRFFMTIFGIGGCMALVLVGFGLMDSIFSIADLQYGKIHKYDILVELEDSDTSRNKLLHNLEDEKDKRLQNRMYQFRTSIDIQKEDLKKSVNMVVLDQKNVNELNDFYHFGGRVNHIIYELSDQGVLLSEKVASTLGIEIGDIILLKKEEGESFEVNVTGIVENYVQNYIFMTRSYYETLFEEDFKCNEIIISHHLEESEEALFAQDLLQMKGVASVSLSNVIKHQFEGMIGNLNIVMLVLIISAGGLAFVVLYNLNNISINERKRELATLKVLGFYDREVSEYVFRENVILTLIGILVGSFLGFILHKFVILTCEIDMLMFGRNIEGLSYIYSALLTGLFACMINLSMHFKLKKVDMASSLKSIE